MQKQFLDNTGLTELLDELGQYLKGKLDVITDLDTIRAGAAAGATAYQKPSTGIPKSDLSSSVLTSLGKADTALQQHQDLSSYADGAEYDSTNHLIYLKHGSTRLANPINANDFIKDGMVDTVEVIGGNLVITFNTDSGKLPITIPINDIFDANNYYNKTESDNRYLLISDLEAITNNEIDIIVGETETLPYDAEIEYLQTSGTQYINTGIILNTRNYELRLKFQWVGSTASQFECFVGFCVAGDSFIPRSGFYKYSGYWMYGTNTTMQTNINVDGSLHEILLSGNASTQKETLYLDGIQIGTCNTRADGLPANTVPYFLGCRNRDDSVDNPAIARFMSLNYKKFGEASHTTLTDEWNFIPVRIGSVGYMYETINGTLMGNIGSGDFILGNDVTT